MKILVPSPSIQTVKLPPYSLQTGTEACSGAREGVLVTFATPQPPSKSGSKAF